MGSGIVCAASFKLSCSKSKPRALRQSTERACVECERCSHSTFRPHAHTPAGSGSCFLGRLLRLGFGGGFGGAVLPGEVERLGDDIAFGCREMDGGAAPQSPSASH